MSLLYEEDMSVITTNVESKCFRDAADSYLTNIFYFTGFSLCGIFQLYKFIIW